MKSRKAFALFHYAIVITIVALGLATMHTYLRRSIQAKVKDLTDHIISERQLASLNDPDSETSTKNIQSTNNLEKREGAGGIGSLNIRSAYTIDVEHEVENLETIDYGKGVAGVRKSPSANFSAYRYRNWGSGPSPTTSPNTDSSTDYWGSLSYGNQGSD